MARARAERSFANDPRSPAEVRAWLRTTVSSWGLADVEDTLLLLVSELSTNAVLHGVSDYDVALEPRTDTVRLSVLDDSTAEPRRRASGLGSQNGRGLSLVDTLARDWGCTDAGQLGGRAKGIWCEVALDLTEQPAHEGAIYGDDWVALLEDNAEL